MEHPPPMIKRFKNNMSGSIGAVVCVVLAGFVIVLLAMRGPANLSLDNPVGAFASAVASELTEAPSLVRAGSGRQQLTYWLMLGVSVASTALFVAMLWLSTSRTTRKSAGKMRARLAVQLLIGIVAMPPLQYVFVAELAFLLRLRSGMRWLGVHLLLHVLSVLLQFAVWRPHSDATINMLLFLLAMNVAVQLLIYAIVHVAARERRARVGIAAANAQLLATQSLLGDAVRASERLRIARDLHDIVGHHLTALNLHLDLALRQATGPALASLATSRGLASALLAEVRHAVSTERQEQGIDLRGALHTLCAGIPAPRIRLAFDEQLHIGSPILAHALFCCVQEAISNAVRHAGAQELSIELGQQEGAVRVAIVDDGHGSASGVEGNGLRGMRERLGQLGGKLTTGNRLPRGFGLEFSLPLAGNAP